MHGATSPRLIDDSERHRYAELLASLHAHFPTPHPLVQWQLERIARLTIQLERIQQVIDAAFIVERLAQSDFERACAVLQLSDDERLLLLKDKISRLKGRELPTSADGALLGALAEVSRLGDPVHLTTHDLCLSLVPTLCRYLVEQARWHNVTLSDYLLTRQVEPAKSVATTVVATVAAAASATTSTGSDGGAQQAAAAGPGATHSVDADIAAAIRAIPPAVMQRAVLWFSEHGWELFTVSTRRDRLAALTEAVQMAATPELDKLDRLMRYQTTINRQLSTAIGELLELTRRGERGALANARPPAG